MPIDVFTRNISKWLFEAGGLTYHPSRTDHSDAIVRASHPLPLLGRLVKRRHLKRYSNLKDQAAIIACLLPDVNVVLLSPILANLSPHSGRKHIAWGVSPRNVIDSSRKPATRATAVEDHFSKGAVLAG